MVAANREEIQEGQKPMPSIQRDRPLSNIFESDEFRLYCFKVLPCSKKGTHTWAACPYAHPGERAQRRDPRTHLYDCEMCPAITKGEECPLDRSCPHSHNAFESWLHPQKYRTLLCKDGDRCNKFVCFFAHGPEQLRLPSNPEPWLAASPAFMPNSCASSLAGTAGGSGSSCQQTQGLVSLMDQVHVARQRAQESRQAALQAEQHLLSVTAALASHAGGMPGQPLHRDPSSLGGVMQSPPMQPTGLQNTGFAPVHKLDAACFATPSPSLVTATSNTMQGLLTVSQPPATGQSLTSTPTSILSTLSSSEPLTLYGSPELQHNPLAGAAPLPGLISSGLLQNFSQSGVPVTTMQSQQQAPVCFVLPQSTQATQQPIVLYQTLGGDVLQSNAGFNTSNNPVYYYG